MVLASDPEAAQVFRARRYFYHFPSPGEPIKGLAIGEQSHVDQIRRDRLRKFIRHGKVVLALPTKNFLNFPERNVARSSTSWRVSCTFNCAAAYCIRYAKGRYPGDSL